MRARLARSPFGAARLRDYWLTAPGIVMLIATVLAVGIRLFTLTRAGYLRGITEYDDGVYIGGALRLIEGQLPYKDFAFIQPPGILLLMTPVALIAKITTTVKGLALARVLTALASAACVPLVGNLVRYRGAVVTLVTCGALAVYPGDITTAHTLMLEPWMNLFCLLGVNAAFRRGHLARPGRLMWAGLALGFAGVIKFWAIAPAAVLLVLCLTDRKERARRTGAYMGALAAGFVLPMLPFLASAPMTFIRSTVSRPGGAYRQLGLHRDPAGQPDRPDRHPEQPGAGHAQRRSAFDVRGRRVGGPRELLKPGLAADPRGRPAGRSDRRRVHLAGQAALPAGGAVAGDGGARLRRDPDLLGLLLPLPGLPCAVAGAVPGRRGRRAGWLPEGARDLRPGIRRADRADRRLADQGDVPAAADDRRVEGVPDPAGIVPRHRPGVARGSRRPVRRPAAGLPGTSSTRSRRRWCSATG